VTNAAPSLSNYKVPNFETSSEQNSIDLVMKLVKIGVAHSQKRSEWLYKDSIKNTANANILKFFD